MAELCLFLSQPPANFLSAPALRRDQVAAAVPREQHGNAALLGKVAVLQSVTVVQWTPAVVGTSPEWRSSSGLRD